MPATTILTTESSAVTVAQDLVTNTWIGSKIFQCVLCICQVISCYVIGVLYIINYYKNSFLLEVVLTWVVIILGIFLCPGIANGVVYMYRFRKSPHHRRQKMQEENKQAWICFRLATSMLGMSPVGRHVETIMAIIRNKRALKQPGGAVALFDDDDSLADVGMISSSHKKGKNVEIVSTSAESSRQGMSTTKNTRKARRSQREIWRCQHDGAIVSLVSGCTGAGVMATVQIFLLARRHSMLYDVSTPEIVAALVCMTLSILWAAFTYNGFYPIRLRQVRHGAAAVGAIVFLYFIRLIMIFSRCIAFALFASVLPYWTLLPLLLHFVAGLATLIACHFYLHPITMSESVSMRTSSTSGWVGACLLFSWASLFDFVNGNSCKTRLRYMILYGLQLVENVTMAILWYFYMNNPNIWYRPLGIAGIIGGSGLGFVLFQVYLHTCLDGRKSTSVSLFGLCCCKDSQDDGDEREYEMQTKGVVSQKQKGAPSSISGYQPSQHNGDEDVFVNGPVNRSFSPPDSQCSAGRILSPPGSQMGFAKPHAQYNQYENTRSNQRAAPPTRASLPPSSGSDDQSSDSGDFVPPPKKAPGAYRPSAMKQPTVQQPVPQRQPPPNTKQGPIPQQQPQKQPPQQPAGQRQQNPQQQNPPTKQPLQQPQGQKQPPQISQQQPQGERPQSQQPMGAPKQPGQQRQPPSQNQPPQQGRNAPTYENVGPPMPSKQPGQPRQSNDGQRQPPGDVNRESGRSTKRLL